MATTVGNLSAWGITVETLIQDSVTVGQLPTWSPGVTLGGNIIATGTISGMLDKNVAIGGTVSTAGNITGGIYKTLSISGTIAVTASINSSLYEQMILSGTVAALASLTGQANKKVSLYGAIASTANITSKLNAFVPIASNITAASYINGYIDKKVALMGAIQATAILTGGLNAQDILSGTVTATGGINSYLDVLMPLAGTTKPTIENLIDWGITVGTVIFDNITVDELPTWVPPGTLACCTIHAQGIITGGISMPMPISGTIVAVGAANGILDTLFILGGTIFAISNAVANLGIQVPLATGTVAALANLTGQVKKTVSLNGTIVTTGRLTGYLDKRLKLNGVIATTATMTGELLPNIYGTQVLGILAEDKLSGAFIPEVKTAGEFSLENMAGILTASPPVAAVLGMSATGTLNQDQVTVILGLPKIQIQLLSSTNIQCALANQTINAVIVGSQAVFGGLDTVIMEGVLK
jgi:hypothetical protein